MVVSGKSKKGTEPGRRRNSKLTWLRDNVTRVADLFRTPKPDYILKVPKNVRLGKVTYTVQSTLEPVTFNKRKDAVAFQKLLSKSANRIESDIVRREITEEGYHLH